MFREGIRQLGSRVSERFRRRKPEVQQGEDYGMVTSFSLAKIALDSGGHLGTRRVYWAQELTVTSNIGFTVVALESTWDRKIVLCQSIHEKPLEVQNYGAVLDKSNNRFILVAPDPEKFEWIEIQGGDTPKVFPYSMSEVEFKERGLDKVYPSLENARTLALEAKRERDQAEVAVASKLPSQPTAAA